MIVDKDNGRCPQIKRRSVHVARPNQRRGQCSCRDYFVEGLRKGVELGGKEVPVYFAISADVSEVLRGKITSLSESAW